VDGKVCLIYDIHSSTVKFIIGQNDDGKAKMHKLTLLDLDFAQWKKNYDVMFYNGALNIVSNFVNFSVLSGSGFDFYSKLFQKLCLSVTRISKQDKSLEARTRLQLTKWHKKRNRLIKIITYSY